MAEEFIEEIYEKADLIPELKKAVQLSRCVQAHLFHQQWQSLHGRLQEFAGQMAGADGRLAAALRNSLDRADVQISGNNFGMAADELEDMIPLLYRAVSVFGTIDVEEGKYRIFSSQSGFLCIQNLQSGDVLNSRIDPVWEACEKARTIYMPSIRRFCMLGCEMGYLAWQMYETARGGIDIYIYDTDRTMIGYALQFGVLSRIPEERLHLVVNPRSDQLMQEFMKQAKFFDQGVAALHVETEAVDRLSERAQETAIRLIIMTQTAKNLLPLTEQNFYRNLRAVKKYVSELKNTHDTWIVAGGGVSVDHNLDYLREMQGRKTIIAASTVYKKLRKEGIRPDYIAAIDPQNRTYRHSDGIQTCDVPLILTDSANWQFGELYRGEKYLVPTGGCYFADLLYERCGIIPWEAEGTVPALGIEVAARLGASSIELVGIDLAYPEKHSHASGTMDDHEVDFEGMLRVRDVNGGEVYTTTLFRDYICDIEGQISKYSRIKFYNLSDCGAYISGCRKRKDS